MTATPLMIRGLERAGFENIAYGTALVGFNWMGFVFEFFCLGLFLDLLIFIYKGLRRISKKKVAVSGRRFFAVVTLLSFSICLYGSYEASHIRRHDITIATNKLPGEAKSLTIVQISDVHLGLLTGRERLEDIIKKIKRINPDLLVCTGDLLDSQGDGLTELAALLRKVSPRLGKFAVTGNHEMYTGIEKSKKFLDDAGFTVLDGRIASPEGVITLAGVGDRGDRDLPGQPDDETKILQETDPGAFVIFLKHRPIVKKESIGHFDLQFSGHTHQGQLFPFNFITRMKFPVPTGKLIKLARGHLYVSRGTGTWGPPIRILAPPEITVFTLMAVENF